MKREYSQSLVLFLAGLVLMMLQSVMIRELSCALVSCEVTILVVTAAYWSGISVGYALAGKIPYRVQTGQLTLRNLSPRNQVRSGSFLLSTFHLPL